MVTPPFGAPGVPEFSLKPEYPDVQRLRRQYLVYLTASKSPETTRVYLSVLDRWIARVEPVLDPPPSEVDQWIRARRRDVAISTFNSELTALRSFYRWANRMDYLPESFSLRLPQQRSPPARLPRHLDDGLVGLILAEPDLSTLIGFRATSSSACYTSRAFTPPTASTRSARPAKAGIHIVRAIIYGDSYISRY